MPTDRAGLLAVYDEIAATYPDVAATIVEKFLPGFLELDTTIANIAKQATDSARTTSRASTSMVKSVNTAAEAMKSALQSLADYARGLFSSDLAIGTPEEQLTSAQSLFRETLAKAQAGNLDAINSLRSVSDTYLREGRDFFASSSGYTAIFNEVTAALLKLTNAVAPGQQPAQMVQLTEAQLREQRRSNTYLRDGSRTQRRMVSQP
jgi:hypothetical protein